MQKIKDFFRAVGYAPYHRLVFISLAVWVVHIILRVLLLFRSNPYGFPFVSKPDWFIFHAICIDFIWICNSLVAFLLLGFIANIVIQKKDIVSKIVTILYGVFHSTILVFTLLDNEVQRFLGGHLSFGLVDTYKDASSIIMFYDYVANDNSIPYLQFFVLVLMLPLAYGLYKILMKFFVKQENLEEGGYYLKKTTIAMTLFYVVSILFVYFIWTGNARMTKLRPVVSLVYNDLFIASKQEGLSEDNLESYKIAYQNLWKKIEGDSLWEFPKEENKIPLYRIPSDILLNSELLKNRRHEKPNFILVLMESQRGLNVGYMNPEIKPSPTPFMDSLAEYSHVWMRMHTSGVPTTGGVLSTHLGIPHHSHLAEATDLAHVTLPSFVSVLTDSGYSTHYMSAADPAWDNLGVWMAKWYTKEHYDRNREDDSTFIDNAISFVKDTLGSQEKPFFVTLMTRSNHYPFNFAAGMTKEQKEKPLQERINITMNYADRQISRFFRAIEQEPWYENTYVIIMADHGFPLGENGVSTMNGGGFSNVSWIPFMIHGKHLSPRKDFTTTAQIDIAPTILELAGIAVPNIFMGHNLLRKYEIDSTSEIDTTKILGMSLGAYSGYAALGLDDFRLVAKYPSFEELYLFDDADLRQQNELSKENKDKVSQLKLVLDTLLKISDYSLERGL